MKLKSFGWIVFLGLISACSLKPYDGSFSIRVEENPLPRNPSDFFTLAYPAASTGFSCYMALAGGPSIPDQEGVTVDIPKLQAGDHCGIYAGESSIVRSTLSESFDISVPPDMTTVAVIGMDMNAGYSCPIGQDFLAYMEASNWNFKTQIAHALRITNQPTFFPIQSQEIVLQDQYATQSGLDLNLCNNGGGSYGPPDTIPGLQIWFVADDIVGTGQLMNGQWSDRRNAVALQAYSSMTGPTVTANAIGSKKAVYFNNANGEAASAATNVIGNANNGVTIFALAKMNATTGNPSSIVSTCSGTFCTGSVNRAILGTAYNPPYDVIRGEYSSGGSATNPQATANAANDIGTSQFHIFTLHGGSSTTGIVQVLMDGLSLNSQPHTYNPVDLSLRVDIGAMNITATPTFGSFFNGYVAEVLVFNREISIQERQQVECYFKNHYAGSVTITDPAHPCY